MDHQLSSILGKLQALEEELVSLDPVPAFPALNPDHKVWLAEHENWEQANRKIEGCVSRARSLALFSVPRPVADQLRRIESLAHALRQNSLDK